MKHPQLGFITGVYFEQCTELFGNRRVGGGTKIVSSHIVRRGTRQPALLFEYNRNAASDDPVLLTVLHSILLVGNIIKEFHHCHVFF
jgi:hypothetical protein